MSDLKSMISQIFYSPVSTVQPTSVNPFASTNPFAQPLMSESRNLNNSGYGKNNPVQGGYFAGYYNNKPNIVGQRLYILA